MQFDSNTLPVLANEAAAALRAASSKTKAENAQRIAALREGASDGQIAEHIRGMVEATMSNLSTHATENTLEHATHWQQWALEVADELAVARDSMGTANH